MNAQQLNEIVDALEAGEKVELNIGNYTSVKLDSDTNDGTTEYTWTLNSNKFPYYVFPSASNPNFIKYFKTLDGAKRNLKKYLRYWLEPDHA